MTASFKPNTMYFTPEDENKIKAIIRRAANELHNLGAKIEGLNVTIKVELPKETTVFAYRSKIEIDRYSGFPINVEVTGRKDPPRP